MKGTISKKVGDPKANRYEIKGEDGTVYFAHVGDLLINEKIVLEAGDKRADLSVNDAVEFEAVEILKPRAIHIKKVV